jgi:hypothetical protein
MRRGLMGWNETDLPLSVLRQRLSRLQRALKSEDLGGLVIYTNIARPAAATFLTGFTPYWSEGLLLIPVSGDPVFATALSKRVSEWIRTVMPIGSIENTPQPAAAIRRKLTGEKLGKVGVLELDLLPAAQAAALTGDDAAITLADATDLFRAVRLQVDVTEIKLVRGADSLARDCLAAVDRNSDARRIAADVEARARLAGAEEVFVTINPDLSRSNAFLRCDHLEGLGTDFALRLSLGLKGAWVRRTITLSRNGTPRAAFAAAEAAFQETLTTGIAAAVPKSLQNGFPGKITAWTVEASVGSYPLEVVACSGGSPAFAGILPISVVSVEAEIDQTRWYGAGPVIGEASSS